MFKRLFLLCALCVMSPSLFAGATEWHEFEIDAGQILLDVEIGGHKTKALLDTGATTTFINADFVEKNNIPHRRGKKVVVEGIFEERKDHMLKDLEVKLFGVNIPVDSAAPFRGDDETGLILGLNFLMLNVMQIDYPNKRMRFIQRGSIDLRKLANVPLKFTAGKSALVAELEVGEPAKLTKLMLDTGNSGGIYVERYFAKSLGWLDKYQVTENLTSGANKKNVEMALMVLPQAKFGPYPLADVIVHTPADSETSTNISQRQEKRLNNSRVPRSTGYDGILGYDILKHFVLTLDAKRGLLHIYAPE